ncbi:MAG: DUF4388 domain-containing protein [Gemmatimonadota bacterium]
MSLEGRIRELGLHEVCQLLGLSRKTGVLKIRAALQGTAAEIAFFHGAITDAAVWTIDPARADGARSDERPVPANALAPVRATVQGVVLDLLGWTDGEFRFVAADPATLPSPTVRIPIEPVLVEAAQRAEVWQRVADRIPGPRAVPAFVEVEAQQLSLLRLVPQEWEILTRVDGQRDLAQLAHVLGRDLLEIVEIVHRLIGAGLLALRDGAPAPRRHATPPSIAAVEEVDEHDLWIPGDDRDVVFDPIRTGVFTPEGLPRLRTPLAGAAIQARREPSHDSDPGGVASQRDDTSSPWTADALLPSSEDPMWLCQRGDDAARRGDLAGALAYWSGALRSNALPSNGAGTVNADRIREAIALAVRLHALLETSPSDPTVSHGPDGIASHDVMLR